MMKELYDTPIRVTEIQPGMVETCKSTPSTDSYGKQDPRV